MIRTVVRYGHPVLRQKGKRVEKVTPAIKLLIQDLVETMHAAKGIGLAAQQIGEAVQVTVLDVRTLNRPSTLELNGQSVNADDYMPMVLINPGVTPLGELVSGPEGCLSFPEVFADINRTEAALVTALNAAGEQIEFRCGGLLARAIQHEVDHLNGILFIDRMDSITKRGLKAQLAELQATTRDARKTEDTVVAR